MVVCIVVAGIISIFSIFAFFGNAFNNTGGTVIPNMFHLMFGGSAIYPSYSVQWKQFGGLTFLFVLEILIIVVAFISFFIAYKVHETDYSESVGIAVSVLSALMSLVASIVSFCTLQITDINQGVYDVQLGFGPVFYSTLHIVVIIILVAGIFIGKTQPSSSNSRSTYSSLFSKFTSIKPSLSEVEKADLILKYKQMLDDEVITKEEFEKKKKELL